MPDSDRDYQPGDRIGPYKVLEQLGEGGMGQVFLAEQTETVRRRVALKVIKLGMDSKQVLARFEAERQALALLDHSSIAKVLDAGTTASGRPYFVMEYVPGQTLVEYCDRHRVSTEQRLMIFAALCDAIQHAHQKGIIHRDLKPSNVLVTVPEGTPVPKVIDFGIAKAIGYRLTELTFHTAQDQAIGTPAYMSPEQAEMRGLDVDTRTDIYTLGVILYELLVGELPFDMGRIPLFAIQIALRETDPPRPSTKFSSLGDNQERVAQLRQTDPRSLARALRGDLDWIVMKAMEKDRTRRYETVNAFAVDVRRHLKHEPVLAGSPGAGYRMRKFVRRHRLGVTAAATVAASIVGGTILATVGLIRAQRAEARAETEAAAARQVADFLTGLFMASNPEQARGRDVTAREMLDQGAGKIRTELADQPLIQAELMFVMGDVYRSLGEYEPARQLLEEAVTIRERELGPQDMEVAQVVAQLGHINMQMSRNDEAERLHERAIAIKEAAGADEAQLAMSLNDLAAVYWNQGQYENARRVFHRVVDLFEGASSGHDSLLATALNNLAVAYSADSRHADAEPLMRRALALHEKVLGPEHLDVASDLGNLGALLAFMDRFAPAESLLRRSMTIREALLKPPHRTLGDMYYALGDLYRRMERYEEAERYLERSLTIFEVSPGRNGPAYAISLGRLANVHLARGDAARARERAQVALDIFTSVLGPEHPYVGRTLLILGDVHRQMRRTGMAERYYRQSLAMTEKVRGPTHTAVAEILEHYALLLRDAGRAGEADSLDHRASAIRGGPGQG